MRPHPVLYTRELPGGGYVAIDVEAGGERPRARLWVERRADPTRRTGHVPPVLAERDAEHPERALSELRAIAADNVTLAQALRSWERGRGTGPLPSA